MKILVIGPSWVGDMMMSQSLYRTLKAQYPQAQIDVMAPQWCRPLLAKMPEVNAAIPMPLGHGALAIGERRKLALAYAKMVMTKPLFFRTHLNLLWCPSLPKLPNERVGAVRCVMDYLMTSVH